MRIIMRNYYSQSVFDYTKLWYKVKNTIETIQKRNTIRIIGQNNP